MMQSERATLFATLIGRARAGDDAAWGRILASYEPVLKKRARYSLPAELQRKESPSDVVQHTLAAAFRRRDRFIGRTPDELRVWLLGIQWNRVRKILRRYFGTARRNVAREVSIDAVGASGIKGPVETASGCDGKRSRLAAAIARLPDDQRQLLRWRYNEGLSFAEIGRRLEIKEDAARMQISRLVSELRRRVSEGDAR
jgi:RNA polymerase sigma-70 factor (subfamily 1)